MPALILGYWIAEILKKGHKINKFTSVFQDLFQDGERAKWVEGLFSAQAYRPGSGSADPTVKTYAVVCICTLASLQPRWDAENPQKLVVHLAWYMHQGTRDPISNRVGSKDQHPKLFLISTCAPWQACARTHRHKHTQIYKCIKILKRKWGMCLMSVTPALKRHKQANLCEFNTI